LTWGSSSASSTSLLVYSGEVAASIVRQRLSPTSAIIVIVGIVSVSAREGTALSIMTIACILVCIAMMSGTVRGEEAIDGLHVALRTDNATIGPSVSSVRFDLDVWISYYDWDYTFDVVLCIDDPVFSRYESVPDVIEDVSNDQRLVQLRVYVPDGIIAGTYQVPIHAHAFSDNGTHHVLAVGNVTIDVMEDRSVPVGFAGGNIVPYYADIPQIIHHLVLSNEGNTVERVLCRYLTYGEEINASFWRGSEEVGPENPVELAPGEYVVIDVVFFIDGIPDEDGVIPITIEVLSTEDEQVLSSVDSQVYKLEKEDEEVPWVPVAVALVVALVVVVLVVYWHWRSKPGD
jgi:hypothetical protein